MPLNDCVFVSITAAALALAACGGGKPAAPPAAEPAPAETASGAETSASATPAAAPAPSAQAQPGQSNEFVLQKSGDKKNTRSAPESKIKPTAREAALKFTVVDKEKGPIRGIIISLTAPDGTKYYTEETSAEGYAELLVPVGKKYDLVYLSLGRRDISSSVNVADEPNQNIRLTLRYKRQDPPPKPLKAATAPEERFILEGVNFDSGKATIRPESLPRLDTVVEYLSHKLSARIEISGHTDNKGNPDTNLKLSEKRAQACRDYLISKGIDGGRIEAVGLGDMNPIASNDTEDGRQQNRRIEAREL